jgi:hypothetical protein
VPNYLWINNIGFQIQKDSKNKPNALKNPHRFLKIDRVSQVFDLNNEKIA